MELLKAIQSENISRVKSLLESGTSPNAFGQHDEHPLIEAVRTGNIELVKLLVEHGADVNISTQGDGYTPLHAAFHIVDYIPRDQKRAHKIVEMVKYLEQQGADINAEGGFCLTPFLLAIDAVKRKEVDFSLLQYLINHGADVNKVLACVDENESRTTAIGASIQVYNLDYSYPTMLDLEIFQLLIDNGADPSIDPKASIAPLDEALAIKEKLSKSMQTISAKIRANNHIIELLTTATDKKNHEK